MKKNDLDGITLNAIKTLLKYADDPEKVGGYGIDVQDEGKVVSVRIGLTYWKNKHPFVRYGGKQDD